MTDRIGIWALKANEGGGEVAQGLEEVQSTETEARLEELLVASPDLLAKGLRLIGRQVSTDGGPLDLLGVDPEGRIVLFELKRGTLTRDAVAQILDYGSELLEREPEAFASLIESSSGRLGIDSIEDFGEWFEAEFPEVSEPPLDELRLVLVGLGVDERARRIVNLLANSGLDIQLLTFQAFQQGEEVLLARRVETVEPKSGGRSGGGTTKQGNLRALMELAREQGVEALLLEAAEFVDSRMPAYRWPHRRSMTFYLNELTDSGRLSGRAYVSLQVDPKRKGVVVLTMEQRGINAAGRAVDDLKSAVASARVTGSKWRPFELPITAAEWPELRRHVEPLLRAVVAGWEDRMRAEEGGE